MMNIVYATDDNYAPQCGISMLSLLENNQDLKSIHFFVLDNGISKENKKKLRLLIEKYENDNVIDFINVSDYKDRIGFSFNTTGFNPIVLARLFLTDYLPADVDMALYIDCDTVIVDSLKGLLQLDMTDKYVAAVPELFMPPKNKENIGFKQDEIYFNAGVLWINLAKWRRDNIQDTFIRFYQQKGGMLPYNDQDIINYCCKGHILKLPQKYNMSPNLRYFPRKFMVNLQPGYTTENKTEYYDMIAHPTIIHFLGDERPWVNGNRNYYRKYFYKYRDMSDWSDMKITYGREWYMFCYHLLNIMTSICPWGRILFSTHIGINIYKWVKKH